MILVLRSCSGIPLELMDKVLSVEPSPWMAFPLPSTSVLMKCLTRSDLLRTIVSLAIVIYRVARVEASAAQLKISSL